MGEGGGSKCFHLNCWQSNCARNSKTIPLLHLLSFFFREKSSVHWVLIHTLKEGWIKIHLKLDIPYYCSWRKKHKQQRKFYNSTLLLFIPPLVLFPHYCKVFENDENCLFFNECIFANFFNTHFSEFLFSSNWSCKQSKRKEQLYFHDFCQPNIFAILLVKSFSNLC